MEAKLIVVLIALTMMVNVTLADFLYNHPSPRADELNDDEGYKCVPGRTIIKLVEKQAGIAVPEKSDSEEFLKLREGPTQKKPIAPTRKKHMTYPTKDESCQICVCSVEGKHEYCTNRPAVNVNECLVMKSIMEKFDKGLPFEDMSALSNRIRRDYIWHNDEIPYNSKSKCFRGNSYYTNSLTANDTDIDIGTDVESLLDYPNDKTCFFCICSTSGAEIACIPRDVSFCNFYRLIRDENNVREMYTSELGNDRPTYFRALSFRLRRTMDNSMFDLLDAGGDTLCCGHPNGHRRLIHNQVRSKLRSMMKKVPKENLLGHKESMKGDYVDFVVNNDKKKR